jgi:hypothetical protein
MPLIYVPKLKGVKEVCMQEIMDIFRDKGI